MTAAESSEPKPKGKIQWDNVDLNINQQLSEALKWMKKANLPDLDTWQVEWVKKASQGTGVKWTPHGVGTVYVAPSTSPELQDLIEKAKQPWLNDELKGFYKEVEASWKNIGAATTVPPMNIETNPVIIALDVDGKQVKLPVLGSLDLTYKMGQLIEVNGLKVKVVGWEYSNGETQFIHSPKPTTATAQAIIPGTGPGIESNGLNDRPEADLKYFASQCTMTYIEHLKGWRIVQYMDDKMFEAVIVDGEEIEFPEGCSNQFRNVVRSCIMARSTLNSHDSYWSHVKGIDKHVMHPARKDSWNLMSIITDLNDHCGWTREKIADWLDTLDEQPIFYPKAPKRVSNFARVVTLKPPIQKTQPQK